MPRRPPAASTPRAHRSRPSPTRASSHRRRGGAPCACPNGRTFVTDGGLSIDVALVKPAPPATLEQITTPALARFLEAPYEKETTLADLRPGTRPNTFTTPDGVVLNGNYVTFLRSALSPVRTRLRTSGATRPVVIVADGTSVGVMMPIQPPRSPTPDP